MTQLRWDQLPATPLVAAMWFLKNWKSVTKLLSPFILKPDFSSLFFTSYKLLFVQLLNYKLWKVLIVLTNTRHNGAKRKKLLSYYRKVHHKNNNLTKGQITCYSYQQNIGLLAHLYNIHCNPVFVEYVLILRKIYLTLLYDSVQIVLWQLN